MVGGLEQKVWAIELLKKEKDDRPSQKKRLLVLLIKDAQTIGASKRDPGYCI